VTCFFCHSVDGVDGSHNNPLRLADDDVMRGSIVDPVDNPAHHAAHSPFLDRDRPESSQLCGACHDIVLPNKLHLERTFAEWQGSIFGNGSTQILNCGNCHMAGSSGLAADFAGVKLREVHDHSMPAVDVALTPFAQMEQQLALVKNEVKSGIIAQVCVGATLDKTPITVVLENGFAGHNIPSGATQDRRLWVQLKAFEGDKEIFASGVVPDGTPVTSVAATDPNLWLLRDKLLDKDGKEVHMFWDAHSIESELLPQASSPTDADHQRQRIYQVPLNAGLVDRVELTMFMRPMGLDVLQDLVASGHLDQKYVAAMPTFVALETIEWTAAKLGNGKKTGCYPKDPFSNL